MMPSASAARLLPQLAAQPLGIGAARADDRLGFDTRLPDDRLGLLIQALELLARLLRVGQRFADRLFTRRQRLQQRPPGELREQRQQHEEGRDGPDEKSWIHLDQRVVHDVSSLHQHDQQHEHFRENRDAFEQEQRQVHGAGNLRRRGRLARDAFRGCGERTCRCRARRR